MDTNNEPMTLLEISEAAKKRVALISEEFRDGFEFIKNYPRSVTFFGSARTKEDEFYYRKAKDLAGKIVEKARFHLCSLDIAKINIRQIQHFLVAIQFKIFISHQNSSGIIIDRIAKFFIWLVKSTMLIEAFLSRQCVDMF